jgi:hypothetical protein
MDERKHHCRARPFSAVTLWLLKAVCWKKTIAIASSAMKTRLSIDTDFEIYRPIIARTTFFISDDDFIVHRGDITNPGGNSAVQ